jgi:glucose dehydrogenase
VNRSGFHYILDRIVGKFLLAEPSVDAATDETLWRFEANRIG